MMYVQNSPQASRRDHNHVVVASMPPNLAGGQSPTKNIIAMVGGVRTSASAGSLLSPSRHRRRSSSNQGSRSGSPLTLPVENMQSVGGVPYSMSQNYLGDGMPSPIPSSPSSRSPFQSPAHSRSSSMNSVKSLLRDRDRDRSSDRSGDSVSLGREHVLDQHPHMIQHHSHHSQSPVGSLSGVRSTLVRDRSLDRQLERHSRDTDRYATYGGHRNRTPDHDRDYPHMGARSLERDHPAHSLGNLVRSRSIDYEYVANQAAFLPANAADMCHSRDTLLLDMQAQIAELNKECATLQQDLDNTKDKLSSSMNSIKTFWSPELKKERSLRKEESAKYSSLCEQMKILQNEKQKQSDSLHQLQEELRHLRSDHRSLSLTAFPPSPSSSSSSPSHPGAPLLSPQHEENNKSGTLTRCDKDKHAKEMRLLRKTVDEMELRIETQKETLSSRDESIKKLLEMLQSKGLTVQHLEEDRGEMERLRVMRVEGERRVRQLEQLLEQRDKQISGLQQDIGEVQEAADMDRASRDPGAMQGLLETKDIRMHALEKEVHVLEEELLRLREDSVAGLMTGSLNRNHSNRDNKMQLESMKSHERLLKTKLESSKAEAVRLEAEVCSLRTQLESHQHQGDDRVHHISVLREQVAAKDRQLNMLQADIDELRERLKEKDAAIELKGKQLGNVQTEKKRLDMELHDLHDHLDIKERKVNVLQRKLEHQEGQAEEADSQLQLLRNKLASYHETQHSADSVVTGLEEAVNDRQRQIDRLKEARDASEQEHHEEMEAYQHAGRELKNKLDLLQHQLDEKQHAALELQDATQELRTEKLRRESELGQLQLTLSQRNDEVEQLRHKIKQLEEEQQDMVSRSVEIGKKQVSELEAEMATRKDEVVKAQTETDRLLEILKATETEKGELEQQAKELQDQVKEYRQKMGTLKRSQQTEKNKNANMLEEARKREGDVTDDASQLKSVIKQREDRVEELEEALRESVKITAQREMVMAQQEMAMDQIDKKMKVMSADMEKLKSGSVEKAKKVVALSKELEKKDSLLQNIQTDKNRHLADVYKMKQEALQAAISEKDAHIALLEMAPNAQSANITEVGRLTQQKHKLQIQLKEITQSQVKLMQVGDSNQNNDSLVNQLQDCPNEHVVQAIRNLEHRKNRLQILIDRLVALCLEIDPELLQGLPRIQLDDMSTKLDQLRYYERHKLERELSLRDMDCQQLQEYTDSLLQRLTTAQPDVIDTILCWLDSAVQR